MHPRNLTVSNHAGCYRVKTVVSITTQSWLLTISTQSWTPNQG